VTAGLSRRALQTVLGGLAAVAVGTGVTVIAAGPTAIPGGESVNPTVDSELRFFAAFWIAYGLLICWVLPRVERETAIVRAIAGVLFLGGIARATSLASTGSPNALFLGTLVLELAGPPLVIAWQARLLAPARPELEGHPAGADT
jgi:uncharacterized protein DUF4345